MKNTMKKLLSLVLVAMLLVCAVPFQAAATEADETLPSRPTLTESMSLTSMLP